MHKCTLLYAPTYKYVHISGSSSLLVFKILFTFANKFLCCRLSHKVMSLTAGATQCRAEVINNRAPKKSFRTKMKKMVSNTMCVIGNNKPKAMVCLAAGNSASETVCYGTTM